MKIKLLILLVIFLSVLVSCEKDMKWINSDDSQADQAEILKICEEKSAECGMVEYEYSGKTRQIFCGECQQTGYECKTNNRCEDIDECADTTLNDCPEKSDCHNLDTKSDGKPYECICKENYSGDDCDPDTRRKDCEGLPENAEWNSVSEITQTWNGDKWAPSNKGTFNEEASETECRYKCLSDFHREYSTCVSNTRTNVECTGLPEHATWNTAESITQTWSGSEWLPGTTGTWNTDASMSECRFKCNEHYNWNSSDKTCDAATQSGTCSTKPANTVWNDDGANGTFTQIWTDSGWNPASYASEYNTTVGTCHYKCDSTHTWENGSCINQKTANCSAKPANTVWNDSGANGTFTQSWSSSNGWSPTSYTSSYSTTAGVCKYKCDSTHTWENGSCINQKTANCSAKPANTVWNDNGANGTFNQNWSSSNGWTPTSYTSSYSTTAGVCRYKCDSSHFWDNSECTNPCDFEPCEEITNSTHECTATSWQDYSCECNSGYFWNGSACKKQIPLGNICTGQNKCYNNSVEITCPTSSSADFFGQDAYYASLGKCTPQSFTVQTISNQKVVLDNNTGLMWQQTIPTSTYTWEDAVSYCDGLTYAGYSDWRLPTPQELLTIVDNGKYNPAIDTAYFPDTPSRYFWSSSTYVYNTDGAWHVGFDYGYVVGSYKTSNYRLRCVR